ncbi:hypothetical protein OROMI_024201 [Orobanche minor]
MCKSNESGRKGKVSVSKTHQVPLKQNVGQFLRMRARTSWA